MTPPLRVPANSVLDFEKLLGHGQQRAFLPLTGETPGDSVMSLVVVVAADGY